MPLSSAAARWFTRLAFAGVIAKAFLWCSKFDSSGGGGAGGVPDATSDTLVGVVDGDGDTSASPVGCFPKGICPNGMCCIDFDGGSGCTDLGSCPDDHAHTRCRRPKDCSPGAPYCCISFANRAPDSGYVAIFQADCQRDPCRQTDHVGCLSNDDCEAGECGTLGPSLAGSFPETILGCR
jgi:hypothetical protein